MKKRSITRNLFCGGVLLSTLAALPVSAELMNTDFASGVDGWSAEVMSYNYPTDSSSTDAGDIFSSYADNFNVGAGAATLFTSADQNNDYWSVVMFQETQLASLSSGQSMLFSLDVSSSLSDPLSDFYFAQLRDLNSNDVMDMTDGGAFDISAWAGNMISFEFGVIDNDFVPEDSITVSDISIRVAQTSVPAPASGILLAGGLMALAYRKTKK